MNFLKQKITETPTYKLAYAAAFLTTITGILLTEFTGKSVITPTTILSSALMVCGFLLWCIPAVKFMLRAWDSPFGKVPVAVLHILTFIVATSLSRQLVAETLGLPPQSFDLTNAFLTILLYIPAFLIVISVIASLLGSITFLVLALALPFQSLITLANKAKPIKYHFIFHAAGASMLGLVLSTSYEHIIESNKPWISPLIKIIALRCDFHKAPNYPQANEDEYIHPLENGFLAYARPQQDRSITIGIRAQTINSHERSITDLKPPFSQPPL
ncbi:TPA: hypothetical protein L5D57_006050 [Pseudomonas aeruginosa]|uniref:hypothetical protein n=1 Tax=Pseudomonas aeruginosa TaxID=287 RepID=UPI000F528950|nr:hypothetical protein [Pseudomonas aeruginosa]MBV5967857.1 hypothetical protein [Pseudomonas aeruginosa]HBO2566990.1 hypothetical protein [Pseudomonas aeruginosa]HBO2617909.1 hypothetical protein [Pseudomonas aeruginosa]HBO2633942.1 hypothetical protein [Pseudomonas aeruginosa]HBO9193760.1 hypothetical protein [Pseudomonas aeruginosa]